MSLTGLPFLLLLVGITLLILAGVYLLWARWPPRLGLAGRLSGLLLVMVMGAALAGDVLNRQFDFYSSFSDLLGTPPGVQAFAVLDPPRAEAGVSIDDRSWLRRSFAASRNGHGTLLAVKMPGTRSGINRDGEIYLPAAYFKPPHDRSFAVVEILHGYPGHPQDYQRNLNLAEQLDSESASGRVPPLVAVLPRTYDHASTECVDGVDGEHDETYLTQDVYDDLLNTFRVQSGRTWATLGVSTGAFCAVNLALHHPERYSAAASLSGYFTAGEDPDTARLYRGRNRYSRNVNSPLWWVTHRSPVAPPLYLFASAGDPSATRESTAMAAALRKHAKGLPTTYTLLPVGGHHWGVWSLGFAPALDWIAQFLPAPLSPAKVLQDAAAPPS